MWKKPRQARASSVAASRERSASVDSRLESQLDSEMSAAESVATSRGPKRTARGKKPTATKPRIARGRDAESELESSAESPPPPSRAPRGRKRTSSALGANRISIFDANDFMENSFAKPAPAKARQSKRARPSTAGIATDEDQQMQYESDASIATNATNTTATKRKRGAGRTAKPIGRYQIPDDEEIDRALELDLEREDTEDDDPSKYTKPFVKTPKRRMTRTRQISHSEAPPMIGALGVAASVPKEKKKFTPAGMRNYFANQDLDYRDRKSVV